MALHAGLSFTKNVFGFLSFFNKKAARSDLSWDSAPAAVLVRGHPAEQLAC